MGGGVAETSFFSLDDSSSNMARKMPEQRDRDAKKRKNKEKRRKFAGKSVFLTPNDSSEGGKPPIKILNVGEKLCCTKKEIRRRLKSAIRFHSFFRSSPQFSFSSVRAVSRRETFSWFFSLRPPSSDSLSVGWSTETFSTASQEGFRKRSWKTLLFIILTPWNRGKSSWRKNGPVCNVYVIYTASEEIFKNRPLSKILKVGERNYAV